MTDDATAFNADNLYTATPRNTCEDCGQVLPFGHTTDWRVHRIAHHGWPLHLLNHEDIALLAAYYSQHQDDLAKLRDNWQEIKASKPVPLDIEPPEYDRIEPKGEIIMWLVAAVIAVAFLGSCALLGGGL